MGWQVDLLVNFQENKIEKKSMVISDSKFSL